ncbi:TadE/TadG family type IV pilus assembly protein [Actinoplanes regularis]|uniref:TadE/TadG family type IV pilus assembly protein n=1 Tax=Actinoplanes regularis TaxID=52697 RepID=UPI0024A57AF6|nr:TadE/TadG family type IV pilus assembly protein [Actinoplanes regularis]GLW34483.1 membrane protein [Actinoplanes regularis]
MRRARLRDAGSGPVELAILAPVVLSVFALVVIGGRVNLARQSMDAAAFDAARSASLERTAAEARSRGAATAAATLRAQGLTCRSTSVTVNVGGFSKPVGQPATVTATVRCTVELSDVVLPGLPGRIRLSPATFTSPLDTYRTRQ